MNPIITILSILFAITATVLAYIFIVPENKKLPAFFRVVRDIFNFKFLVIEKVMQALYILSTLFIILYGFFGIFFFGYETTEYVYTSSGSMWESLGSGQLVTKWVWTGWVGFLILILGPIFIRLAYEAIMMFLILIKNVIQINNKLGTGKTDADKTFDVPAFTAKKAPAEEAPVNKFCPKCGTHLDENGKCANCDK
jgi:hypothetical protein